MVGPVEPMAGHIFLIYQTLINGLDSPYQHSYQHVRDSLDHGASQPFFEAAA